MRLQVIRRLAISGGLVAAAFALKYPLIGIPNVEPLTLVFFTIGYVYGSGWGALVGAVGELIYATFNPYGAQIFPVWIAQIAGMALAGVLGGAFRLLLAPKPDHERGYVGGRGAAARRALALTSVSLAGIITTLCYDLLTNLALALAIGPFWPTLVAALPFVVIHLVSNALLFPLIFPILRRWLLRPTTAVVEPGAPG